MITGTKLQTNLDRAMSGGFQRRTLVQSSIAANVARAFPRQEGACFVGRLWLPHPFNRLVSRYKIDVVKVGQQSLQEPQKSLEVLGVGEEPVCVEVDAERCPVATVEPSKVVPEVGKCVSESSHFRLSGTVTRVYHGTWSPRPVQHVVFQLSSLSYLS